MPICPHIHIYWKENGMQYQDWYCWYLPQKSTVWYALMGWLSPHIADKRYRLSLLALHHPCWMSRLMWLGVYLQDIQYITNYFRLGWKLNQSTVHKYYNHPESVCLSFVRSILELHSASVLVVVCTHCLILPAFCLNSKSDLFPQF